MTDDNNTLLPLGSALKIKGDESIYIIIARGFQKKDDGTFITGYKGVPHPYGENSKYKTVTIPEGIIEEIVHQGFENEEDVEYIKEKLAEAVPPPKPQKISEQPEENTAVKKEQLENQKENNNDKNPANDPFYTLRNRRNKHGD